MISPLSVLVAVLPVYLILLAGALLRRLGVLHREHDTAIMHLVFAVLIPAFILDKTLGAAILRNPIALVMGGCCGFMGIVVGISCGLVVGKLIGLRQGHGYRTFALTSGCQNFGFTAIPVVEILWGSSAVAILFVHNLGVEAAMWSVGVATLTAQKSIPWKSMLNGPMLAVLIALGLVVLRLDQAIVGPPREAISLLGSGAFPIALLITGATILDLAHTEKPSWKIIGAACLVRLVLVPAAILLAARFLPLLATELKQVLLVQAAMPAAMTPIMIARLYGGSPVIAVQIVLATALVSLVTLPLIITGGLRFLELEDLAMQLPYRP